MTMPRRAADLCGTMHKTKSVCAAGRAAQTQKSSPDAKKRSRCRQVPRRRSGVSDLSAPTYAGGLHSDPLAGLCTPFRLSAQHAGRIVCRCFILSILKYHIKNGFSSRMGEKCGGGRGENAPDEGCAHDRYCKAEIRCIQSRISLRFAPPVPTPFVPSGHFPVTGGRLWNRRSSFPIFFSGSTCKGMIYMIF